MDFINIKKTINTKYYGKVKTWISRKCKRGNGYLVITIKDKKTLCGYIDLSFREVIPLQEMQLTGMLVNDNGKDICFEFEHFDNNVFEYYHVKNYDNGVSKLILNTRHSDDIPLAICTLDDTDDYWLLKTVCDTPQYAIYDYKKAKIISTFLDEIQYQDYGGDPSHVFYYSLAVKSDVKQYDGKKVSIMHTNLCGFLNKDGNLSSQIYDTSANLLYNSYIYGPDTFSPNFNELILSLTNKYEDTFYSDEEHINEVLSYLYSNPNLSEKPKNIDDNKKILKYRPRKKV